MMASASSEPVGGCCHQSLAAAVAAAAALDWPVADQQAVCLIATGCITTLLCLKLRWRLLLGLVLSRARMCSAT